MSRRSSHWFSELSTLGQSASALIKSIGVILYLYFSRLHKPIAYPIIHLMSSGGLAVVRHLIFGAKGHWFDPSKRSKHFQRFISRLTTSWVTGHVKSREAVSTELIKNGDVKDPLRVYNTLRQWPLSVYFGSIIWGFNLQVKLVDNISQSTIINIECYSAYDLFKSLI